MARQAFLCGAGVTKTVRPPEPPDDTTTPTGKMSSGLRRSNSSAIGKLFLNGKYSDLIIRCQGTDFRVHRAIVCPQCPFFDAACSGGFRVGNHYFLSSFVT